MRVKLFFLLDVLATSILTVYTFFLRDEEVAISTGISVFVVLFPLCLWLSEALVLQFAKGVLSNSEITVNNKNALVKLVEVDYEKGEKIRKPVSHTFTNEYGEFVFGPLCPDRKYAIDVWVNKVKTHKVCAKADRKGKCLKGVKVDACDFIGNRPPCIEPRLAEDTSDNIDTVDNV